MSSSSVTKPRPMELAWEGGVVSALYMRPRNAIGLFVLAHGAGAGMRHEFLEEFSEALATRGVATLRYQFPFMESRATGGRRPPDRAPILEATVRAAVARGKTLARGIPLIAGGKSMGGRMTSQAVAAGLDGLSGIAFLGFPLHPARREEKARERAAHLTKVTIPMLFVQGTRDALAGLPKMRRLARRLEKSSLHVVDGADHGFDVLVRSGRTKPEVVLECAEAVGEFIERTC